MDRKYLHKKDRFHICCSVYLDLFLNALLIPSYHFNENDNLHTVCWYSTVSIRYSKKPGKQFRDCEGPPTYPIMPVGDMFQCITSQILSIILSLSLWISIGYSREIMLCSNSILLYATL